MTTFLNDNGVQFADGSVLASTVRGALFGCILSTAGASATMSIAAGQWTDSTNQVTAGLTAIAKTTAAWAVGTAAGGLDTGTIAVNSWYHYYIIRRPDTGVVDVLFSLSATAPTLPASYTQFRRIGSGLTNASSQWTQFKQVGNDFYWFSPPLDCSAAGTLAATLQTLSTPLGVIVKAYINVALAASFGNDVAYISDPANADLASSTTAAPLGNVFTSGGTVSVFTNTSSQVRRRSAATTNIQMVTTGWNDERGRVA